MKRYVFLLMISVYSFTVNAQVNSGQKRFEEMAKETIDRMAVIAFLTPEQEKAAYDYEVETLKLRADVRSELANNPQKLQLRMKEVNSEYYIKMKLIIGIGNMQSWMENQK